MSCTTLTIECFKAAYTANVGYDSLFCGLKVTCDSNVKYIRAPYVADFNGNTLMLHGWDKSETVIDDVTVTGLSVAQVKDLVATCCCGDDQHLIVNNTPVGYIPTTSGNTSNLNEVVIDSGGDTWIIDINGDARKFNKGTVTSVNASISGALSVSGGPITTSGTLAFSWTGTSGQYVRGDGVLQAFPTIPSVAIPSGELVWGTGTGISSTGAIKQFLYSNLRIGGGGTITGSYGSLVLGNPSINIAPCSLILSENTDTVLTGNGNKAITFLQGNYNYINTDVAGVYDAYRNTVIGIYNVVNATTSSSSDNVVIGSYNTVTGGGANIVFGSYFNASHYGGLYIGDRVNTPIYSTANYEAIFRFYNGFKFYTNNNTTIGLLIAGNRDITMSSLAGSGTLMVVADINGKLSKQAIPTGTVTGFSAGGLSPLFTTSVDFSTTTPHLNFILNSTVSQYQVFGRVVAGTGAPSYVTLNPIAFNGLAIPSGELVYGTGTSVTSLNKYRVVAGEGIVSGDGIGIAYFGMYAGNGVNEGGALRIKRGSNFVTYIGSDSTAFGVNNDNTTIFAYGNNSVNIATNSVRRLIVDGNGYVTINNIPTAASATDILVSNGGVVSTRTVASLGIGGGSAVWYIQGTATDATTNAQDIVRTGKVRIGASGTSTYMLSVVGNAYIMNGVEINNNQSYKGFNTSATAVNLIKINSSNYIEIGQSSYDIYLPNYTSSRSADTVSTSDKYLYVNSSGYLKADSAQWVRNDGASAYITSSESHAADSTDRKVKFDVANFANNGYYGLGGSSGDYRINFPSGDTYHFVVVTLEYTTSGTPTVTATLRRVSTTIETNVSTSADGRKVMTIHTMMSGSGTSDYPTVYLSVSGSAITLQKCRMTVIPMGAVPP